MPSLTDRHIIALESIAKSLARLAFPHDDPEDDGCTPLERGLIADDAKRHEPAPNRPDANKGTIECIFPLCACESTPPGSCAASNGEEPVYRPGPREARAPVPRQAANTPLSASEQAANTICLHHWERQAGDDDRIKPHYLCLDCGDQVAIGQPLPAYGYATHHHTPPTAP